MKKYVTIATVGDLLQRYVTIVTVSGELLEGGLLKEAHLQMYVLQKDHCIFRGVHRQSQRCSRFKEGIHFKCALSTFSLGTETRKLLDAVIRLCHVQLGLLKLSDIMVTGRVIHVYYSESNQDVIHDDVR